MAALADADELVAVRLPSAHLGQDENPEETFAQGREGIAKKILRVPFACLWPARESMGKGDLALTRNGGVSK